MADDFWIGRAIVLVFHLDNWIDRAFGNGSCRFTCPSVATFAVMTVSVTPAFFAASVMCFSALALEP